MNPSPSRLSRRTLFAGASAAGAVAGIASLLPVAPVDAPSAVQEPRAAPQRGGGYSLSEHVKRYYRTTRT